MNKSTIEWTQWTSNPIYVTGKETGKRGWHCERVSPGCAHCYARTQNLQMLRGGTGLDFREESREALDFVLNENELREWAKPKYAGQRCFAFDMTDLFGEWVSDEWLAKIIDAFRAAPDVQFQILTKRPERMCQVFTTLAHNSEVLGMPFWPLPNVWLGVTVENQRWADERIPILLDTPATVRFVSAEPLLQKVELWKYMDPWKDLHKGTVYERTSIDWVVVGGESGSKHRDFDPAWAREIVDDGKDHGCAIFVKQLGGARPGNRLEDLPADLRVREFPA